MVSRRAAIRLPTLTSLDSRSLVAKSIGQFLERSLELPVIDIDGIKPSIKGYPTDSGCLCIPRVIEPLLRFLKLFASSR